MVVSRGILQSSDVHAVKTHQMEDKVYQLAGQFAELFLLVKKHFVKRGPAALVDDDFSCSFCEQRSQRAM